MDKYLIIAPSWVGDAVMAQSLYRLLKQQNPSVIIDIAAPQHCCELAGFMPEINRAFPLHFTHGQFGFFARRAKAKTFKTKAYTHAIVLPNSWKSALIPFFAGINRRIGYHGEMRFFLLNDRRRLNKEKYPRMIDRFCALGIEENSTLPAKLPIPQFRIDKITAKNVQQKFHIDDHQHTIALCPGAEFGPTKKWPTHYYAKVARTLLQQGSQVILFGNNSDIAVTREITEYCKSHQLLYNLAGKTSLTEAVYLLSRCQKALSNDSGLMHIASALGIPTLVIYGSTSDQFTPPLNPEAKSIYVSNLSCRPCFKRHCPLKHMNCMNQLKPDQVIASLLQLQSAHKVPCDHS